MQVSLRTMVCKALIQIFLHLGTELAGKKSPKRYRPIPQKPFNLVRKARSKTITYINYHLLMSSKILTIEDVGMGGREGFVEKITVGSLVQKGGNFSVICKWIY